MAVEDSVAQDQLRAFIERIERMNEEAEAIKADTKEIYAEAKGNGFDTKIIRKIVTIRKQDANERMEQEGLLDLYMSALGMVGVSGAHIDDRRNSIADEIDDALLETVAETAKTPEGRKALLDAVEAHKNGKKVSQLRADPALAIVEPANLKTYVQKVHESPEPQPAPQAGSGLTVPPSPQGQVAPNPSEPVWQSGAPAGMERHPYSDAFGTLGQDIVVIADDVMKGKAAPIVMLGDQVLDGWARFQVAIGAVGLTGQSTEYQVVQYDGSDPLLDCIRWNVGGRILSNTQKQTVANRLIAIEPKRKAEIIKAVAEMAI